MSAFGSFDGGVGCCDRKVDVITLVVAIGSIVAAAIFLRQAVIDNMIKMARRRKRGFYADFLLTGIGFLLFEYCFPCLD